MTAAACGARESAPVADEAWSGGGGQRHARAAGRASASAFPGAHPKVAAGCCVGCCCAQGPQQPAPCAGWGDECRCRGSQMAGAGGWIGPRPRPGQPSRLHPAYVRGACAHVVPSTAGARARAREGEGGDGKGAGGRGSRTGDAVHRRPRCAGARVAQRTRCWFHLLAVGGVCCGHTRAPPSTGRLLPPLGRSPDTEDPSPLSL